MGIVIYAVFIILGFLTADLLYKEKGIYFRAWVGGLIGTLVLMWGIIPFAFLFGFSILAHIILLVAFAGVYAGVFVWKKHTVSEYKRLFRREENPPMTHLIFLCVILPVSIIMWVLLTNHILAPIDGGVASGQSTYGDLAMHMGIITSVAERGVFPPAHNLIDGYRLCYPFLVDTLSSSLYLFGTGLRAAILAPSYVMCILLAMGFYFLAYKLIGKRKVAVLATVLFFIGGGFGFSYFFEGAKADPTAFTRIFTDYYHTPTNYNEENIRWANAICDMIVPQRTTMAGWTYLMFALWALLDAIESKKTGRFVLLGLVAGCMPMIHTHSFMCLGIISAVMFVWYMIKAEDKKAEFKNWLIYGGIAVVMAVPQLFIWTFGQAGSEGFVKFQFNWVNEEDPYLWFWLKNWGIAALFAVPAFLAAKKEHKVLLVDGILIFAIAELILFQPNAYDNNKLFFVAYMLILIFISDYLFAIFDKFKGVKGRYFLAALVIAAGTLSGALTIGREYHSGYMYQTFSDADIEYAEFVKENTDSDGTFAAYYGHLNPTAVLAGRQMFYGGDLWMGSHGYGTVASERKEILEDLYSASSTDEARRIAEENSIEYIVLSNDELSNFDVNSSAIDGFEEIYNDNGFRLYRVN